MPGGKERTEMDSDYRQAMVAYRTSMSLAAELLSGGLISEKDYAKIDRIIAKRHGLSLCSICLRKPLIAPDSRGNMHATEGGDIDGSDD